MLNAWAKKIDDIPPFLGPAFPAIALLNCRNPLPERVSLVRKFSDVFIGLAIRLLVNENQPE
jgi:hypothetical protein